MKDKITFKFGSIILKKVCNMRNGHANYSDFKLGSFNKIQLIVLISLHYIYYMLLDV